MITERGQVEERGKEWLPEEGVHKSKPNLLRVAVAIANDSDPYKTANALLSLIERSSKDSSNGNKDIGLLLSDVLALADKSQ